MTDNLFINFKHFTMRKSLFLMASLAAFAMAACNSFEEPVEMMNGDGEQMLTKAGEQTQTVTSEIDLKRALKDKKTDITIGANFTLTSDIEFNYPITINGSKGNMLTTTASLICTSDVTFKDLTIDATTPRGTGAITMAAEKINVVLDNVYLTQHTAGTADALENIGLGINNTACNNSLKLIGITMELPSNYVRAISMYSGKQALVEVEIKDSHITLGSDLSFPSTYGRALSFSDTDCENLVIDNSTLEGAYYVVNVNGTSQVTANVINGSILDGRAAFNVWSPNFTANVTESTLIGRNNYNGPTEEFANIVINQGAENGTLNLTNATFKMEVSNSYTTNRQYAVSLRESNQTITLAGIMKVFDTEYNNVTSYFAANMGLTNLNLIEESGFKLEHEWVDASEIN